jgi:integrase
MSYKLLPSGHHQWKFRLGTDQKQVTASDFKEGEKEVRRLQYEFENGITIGDARKGITFFDICDGYLKDQTKAATCTHQKKKTMKSQTDCFKRDIPNYQIGLFNEKKHEAYNAVSRWMEDYSQAKNRLGENQPINPSSVNRKFNTLRAIFNWAMKKGYLHENPCKRVSKLGQADALPRFLENKEIEALFETSRRQEFINYCTIVLNTGMRPGEVLGLQIEQIDIENRVISGFKQKNQKRLGSVPIKDSLVAPLKKMMGNRTSGSLLNYTLGMLREDAEYGIKRAKINGKLKPGTSRFTIYGLRHTFASHMLMAGEKMETVSTWLRHSSIEQCYKHYGHLTRKYLVESGNKIDLVPKFKLKVVGDER